MAEEELKQTESFETGQIPEAFNKATEEIEKEKKAETAQEEVSEQTEIGAETGEAEETAEESTETPVGVEGLENIDPEVLECCRDAGFKDEIIATFSPELLSDIREEIEKGESPEMKVEQEPLVEKQRKEADSAIEELKFNLDPDIVGTDVKSAIDAIAKAVNENRKGFQEERSRLESERKIANTQRIDACFDRFTKEIPKLGNSSRLTKGEAGLRQEIHGVAFVLAQQRKIPIERAIGEAVNMYKYKDGKKVAQQELLDKLNKQKPHFTNKPTRRAGETERKFSDEYEAADYRMAKAEQEAGLEI